MGYEVLSEAYEVAYQTNSRKPTKSRKDKKAAFDVQLPLVDEGVPSKFISSLTYFNNNMPGNCMFLTTASTMSNLRFVLQDGWFPNEICPGSLQI